MTAAESWRRFVLGTCQMSPVHHPHYQMMPQTSFFLFYHANEIWIWFLCIKHHFLWLWTFVFYGFVFCLRIKHGEWYDLIVQHKFVTQSMFPQFTVNITKIHTYTRRWHWDQWLFSYIAVIICYPTCRVCQNWLYPPNAAT